MGITEYIGNVYDKTKDYSSKKVEDLKEVWDLSDEFRDIKNTQDYFEEHKKDLSDIGSYDVFVNTKITTRKFRNANKKLSSVLESLENIKSSDLRFSEDFLQNDIDALEDVLDELDSYSIDIFHDIVNQNTKKGYIASFLMPKYKEREVLELSMKIKNFRNNIAKIKESLKSITDKNIKTYSNNSILNLVLFKNNNGPYDNFAEEDNNAFVKIYKGIETAKIAKDNIDNIL